MADIKWRESDIDRLRKTVDKYNRKIARLQKTGNPFIIENTPPKLSVKQIRSDVVTRAQLNKVFKSAQAFIEKPTADIGKATPKGSIKWRPDDLSKLKSDIKKFNRKIDRLSKTTDPVIRSTLPDKITFSQAKAQITTRAQLNRLSKQMARFTEKGSETVITTKKGVRTTKYELAEMRARVAQINRERKKARERLGIQDVGNKPLMGRIEDMAYKHKRSPGSVRPEDWERYKESVYTQSAPGYKQEMDARYKENYLKMLRDLFKADDPRLADMEQIIDDMTLEDFIDASLSDDVLWIKFYLDPQENAVKQDLVYNKIINLRK